jgi:hypothetical protein
VPIGSVPISELDESWPVESVDILSSTYNDNALLTIQKRLPIVSAQRKSMIVIRWPLKMKRRMAAVWHVPSNWIDGWDSESFRQCGNATYSVRYRSSEIIRRRWAEVFDADGRFDMGAQQFDAGLCNAWISAQLNASGFAVVNPQKDQTISNHAQDEGGDSNKNAIALIGGNRLTLREDEDRSLKAFWGVIGFLLCLFVGCALIERRRL